MAASTDWSYCNERARVECSRARLFYDGHRFTRTGALPPNTVRLLQDKGSVQTLDGGSNRHRKAMFMSLMTADSLERLVDIFERTWHSYEGPWRQWGRSVIDGFRDGTVQAPQGSAAAVAGVWENPETFKSERFRDWDNNPCTLVPQGSRMVDETHRCPGERITVELIKKAAQLLASTRFTAPAPDLTYSLDRLPALPKSGFVLQGPGYRTSSA